MNRLDPNSRQDDLEAFSAIVRSVQTKGYDRDSQKFLNEAAKFYAISGERVKAELRLHSGERKLAVPPQSGSQFALLSSNPLANKALALANFVKEKVESLPKQSETVVSAEVKSDEKKPNVQESPIPPTAAPPPSKVRSDASLTTAVKLIESKAFREKANYITLASGATVALARRRPDVTSQMPKPNILNQKQVKLKRGFINELIPAVPVLVKSDVDLIDSSTTDNCKTNANVSNQIHNAAPKASLGHPPSNPNLKRPMDTTNNNSVAESLECNQTRNKNSNFVNKSNVGNCNQFELEDKAISSKRARINAININHAADAVFQKQVVPVSSISQQTLGHSMGRNPVQSRVQIPVSNVSGLTWGVSGANVRKDVSSMTSYSNPPVRNNSEDDDSEPEFDTSRFNNSSNRKRTVTVGATAINPGAKSATSGTSGPSSSFHPVIALHPVPYIPTAPPGPQQTLSDLSTLAPDQQGSSSHATNKVMPSFHQKPKVIVGNVASQYGNIEYVQSSANNNSSERYYVNTGTAAASANESSSSSSPRLPPSTVAATFSFSELQEVAGRQLVLSKVNHTSNLPYPQQNTPQQSSHVSETPSQQVFSNSINAPKHPRIGEIPSDWGHLSQRVGSVPLRASQNETVASIPPTTSSHGVTLSAPVARVQITPPVSAPQSPGRSAAPHKQTPGSIFTVSASQLPLANVPTGVVKSKIQIQTAERPTQHVPLTSTAISPFQRKPPSTSTTSVPRAIIQPHSTLGQPLLRNLDARQAVLPKAVIQPNICYMSSMSSEGSKNNPPSGPEHVLPLGNGSRVRTSATVMGSNLRMGKYPLNVNDSQQVSTTTQQQAQGHHLVNITTIYGDLAHSAGNTHNNNANTSNVNHISPRGAETVAQTFTAYSTQPRKISNHHENKFKLVAVPSLHASSLQTSAINPNFPPSGKDYKTFSEQVSSREQIAQVYIAANSTNQNTQSNVPSNSHTTPHHYSNVQIISGSELSHASNSPAGYPIVSASMNSSSYVVYSSKSNTT